MKSPPVGDHSSHQEESEVGWAFILQVSVVGPGAVWRVMSPGSAPYWLFGPSPPKDSETREAS